MSHMPPWAGFIGKAAAGAVAVALLAPAGFRELHVAGAGGGPFSKAQPPAAAQPAAAALPGSAATLTRSGSAR